MRLMRACLVVVAMLLCLGTASIQAQTAPPSTAAPTSARPMLTIPPGAEAGPGFDAEKATQAYLATQTSDQKQRSDAYFEGGYWVQLWSFLIAIGLYWLVLSRGWSAAMRDRAERWTRYRGLQVALYWAQFITLMSVATFPFEAYTGFVREHQYGMATQTFGPWLGDQAKGFAVSIVMGSLAMMALYAVLRRVREAWWIWATGVIVAFAALSVMIAPVYIAPIFNSYTRLTEEAVRQPVLSLARANGIPANDVFVMDASRQTTRISANVSGLGSTMRVTLNDNLLNRSSLEEIEAVLGHEMGHYVLNHMPKMLPSLALLTALGFGLIARVFGRLIAKHPHWRIQSVADVAGLPLILLLFACYSTVTLPINNTLVRTSEQEADTFGLNASRQPDGFAAAALKLGEYRKLSPGPIEEFIFFDHPSGHTRIFNAMRWKAEHLADAR